MFTTIKKASAVLAISVLVLQLAFVGGSFTNLTQAEELSGTTEVVENITPTEDVSVSSETNTESETPSVETEEVAPPDEVASSETENSSDESGEVLGETTETSDASEVVEENSQTEENASTDSAPTESNGTNETQEDTQEISAALTLNQSTISVSPTLTTDKDDYHPGETATIFGNFFQSLQNIVLKIFGSDENDENYTETIQNVTADDSGSFTSTYTLDNLYRPFYWVTAASQAGEELARMYFRDSSIGTYDQCSNDDGDGYASGDTGCRWINGNLNSNNSTYFEGDSTVQRLWLEGYAPGSSHTVTFKYGTTKAGRHAYDYLTTWSTSENWVTVADRCDGITGCTTAAETTVAMQDDPNVTNTIEPAGAGRLFTMRGGTLNSASVPAIVSGSYAGDSETEVTVSFTVAGSGPMCSTKQGVTSCGIAIWFGAHVAKSSEWQAFNGTTGAGSISGSPYHVQLAAEDGASIGNRDNQMQSNTLPSSIIIRKITDPVSDPQVFSFANTGNGNGYNNFTLTGGNSNTQTVVPKNNANTFIITEGAVAQWNLTNLACQNNNASTSVTTSIPNRQVTIVLDKDSSSIVDCTFTNTKQQNGTIIVDKVTIPANSTTSFNFDAVGGAYADFSLTDAATPNSQSLVAGNYSISETVPAGWALTNTSCVSNIGDTESAGSLELDPNETITCTFTNSKLPTLTLQKTVVNNNGGTATTADFQGKINGGNVPWNVAQTLTPGNYTASEDSAPGYAASAWGTDCAANGTVTLAYGENKICTITNNDIAPSLTLNKIVVNDNGGSAAESDWTLTASGPTPISGPGAAGSADVVSGAGFSAGTYTLSESAGPSGYSASSWSCVGGTQNGNQITLGLNQSSTCTITNNDIAPKLILQKTVINDNGGTATTTDFQGKIDGNNVAWGAENIVSAGAHTASETGLPGYAASSWGGDCAANGSVTLAVGETKTCTITNNDIAPTLTLVKTVINDNGGTATTTDFQAKINGSNVPWGIAQVVSAGNHTASEVELFGYTASAWGGDCAADGSVTLAVGQNKTCSITNNDIAPKLIVIKHVINDNGGNAVASDFSMLVNATNTNPAGQFPGEEAPGTMVTLDAGIYSVAESVVPGYAPSFGPDCSGTIAVGEEKTCTVTNDDVAPTITLIKNVINDNGGTAGVNDFALTIGGNGVLSGVTTTVNANTPIALNETLVSGYSFVSITGDNKCPEILGGTVTLDEAEHVTCTITNNDDAPSLTLIKEVINDNGGTATESAWTLTASGTTGFSGNGPSVSSSPSFDAGTYDLSESGPAGYSASDWVCVGGTQNDGDSITLGLGESATCTITNNDIAPSLTLNKIVVNDNGGSAAESDWTLTASGPTPISGPGAAGSADVVSGASFDQGTYVLSESTGPDGYTASDWTCVGGTQNGNEITLGLGESAVCTITNDDEQAYITVTKVVLNNNGGTAAPDDFNLTLEGDPVSSGVAVPVNPGTYTAGETLVAGYSFVGFTGDCDTNGDVAVALGESKTCTLTNDDLPGHLIVHKVTLPANDQTVFSITLSAPPVSGSSTQNLSTVSDVDYTVNAGTYSVTEAPEAGWDETGNTCVNVAVANGETEECTITNTKRGHITIEKQTIGGDGEFTFTGDVSGALSDNETETAEVIPGTYSSTETVLAGWDLTDITCNDDDSNGNIGTGVATFNVAPGEDVKCTFTNTKRGKITIVKDADPNDSTDFNFTGTLGAFTLDDDAGVVEAPDPNQYQNSQMFANLLANASYTISETEPNAFWQMKNIVCSEGANVVIATTTTNGSVTINLQPGQEVTCTFVNEKKSPTRTIGFWQTHTTYTSSIFTTNLGSSMLIGSATNTHKGYITTTGQLFGAFYSNIAKKTNNQQRTALDKARMQLLQQLVGAKLNCAAFGCSSSVQTMIANADAVYAGSDVAAILAAAGQMDAFNNSGDTIVIGNAGKATPKTSQTLANKVFWDNP